MEYITDFPSEQAEVLQKHLKELDEQGKLKEEFLKYYQNNMGKPNRLANYIDKNWETRGKKLYMEYTGIEVYKEDKEKIKAIGIKLNEISYGSKKLILWKCIDCSYQWIARPNDRTNNQNCPVCGRESISNALHLRGETLADWCKRKGKYGKQIEIEFMGEKENGAPIDINSISKGDNTKVNWKCSICNYIWAASVNKRTCVNRGCPACAGTRLIKGVNDLETYCNKHSELKYILDEFIGETKNGDKILSYEISRGSYTKVKWKCSKCNYTWYATPNSRTSSHRTGCPKCGGTSLIKGVNDLETYCKENNKLSYLLKEFKGEDAEHNKILASNIARSSHTMVYWECAKCNNIWLASPNSRTQGTGCPCCAANTWTSFPEQYIYQSLRQMFPKSLNRIKDRIHNYEYDIAIPELKLCIEYSGYYYHKNSLDRDKAKEQLCKENKINFLQIYAYDKYDGTEKEVYTKEKIEYNVSSKKEQHIEQLKHIIEFILQEYAPEHTIEEIDFNLATNEANKIMGKV